MTIRLLLILSLLVAAAPTHADSSTRVYPLHLDKTYRQDYSASVLRDPHGYLWIASDNGLKRYDGYTLQYFTYDPNDLTTIGSPNIFKIFIDARGTMWALGSVLSRYHPENESFTRYYVSDYKVLYAAADSADGGIWLGGDRTGLLLLDPSSGEIRKRFLDDGDTPQTIYNIIPQRDSNKLWLGSSTGLVLFDPSSGESTSYFQLPDTQGFRRIMGLAQDSDGDLWIANRHGLNRINPKTREVRRYTADPGTPGALQTNELTSIGSDRNNNIWLGTEKQGVFRHDPNTDSFIHYPASAYDQFRFPPAGISSIYEDPEGTMWFTCGLFGVVRISEDLQKFKSFRHSFDSDNALGFNHLSGMFEDSKGYIWLGTDGNGVDRFDPRTYAFKHFRHDPNDPETLGSNAVLAIAEDADGYIWLGTWAGGLNRLDPDTGKVTRFMHDPTVTDGQTLAENHVFVIHIDMQNRLVMAVGGSGLQIFDPANNRFQNFRPDRSHNPNGLLNENINAILPTSSGDYWIGGYQALELFSPKTGKTYIPNITLNQAILDLHMDKSGLLWIATDRGLFRFNTINNEVAHFGTKDGLNDEFVVSIEQDSLGYLWLATRNGLIRFEPTSKATETFDELDGLAGIQFNRFSHLQTRAGLLYFGSDQGFSFFDPLQIPRNEIAPHIHLTDLEVNHQLQRPTESPWLEYTLDLTDHIVLPSTADDIKLGFAATNLIAPQKNRVRYRLKGQNDHWVNAGEQRSAQYSNLPPGTYTFQLLAANNDGVWTGKTRDLTITILPAWWQTWWAYCLYIILLLGSIYGFSMLRLHLTIKRRKELEQQVNEQTGKLKEANRAISQLNSELEQRVAQRTSDLSAEVEERKESEAKATYIAYHDILTGLYNRAWLLQHLDKLTLQADTTTPDKPFALLFVGGDRFRTINDTYGHQTGDKLLTSAAAKLRQICPEPAQVARLGGDEFVVVMDQLTARTQAASLAETIVNAFKEPFALDQLRLTLSVSVGYVVSNRITDTTQVLQDANIAMQKAKDRGRGMSQEFDEEILQQMLDQAALDTDLKLALSRNQFSVVYQPIIQLQSIATVSFEVLIRWHHPERGMVPPDRFIVMAEASGLIFDIGIWVLEQACQQLRSWREACGDVPLPVIAVNLSPIQLEREDFLDCLDEIFLRTGVNTENIEFEITESALLRHTETVNDTLEALRKRGIKLAIDDFGTGYSSLSYLDTLPVQVLKIDRSFVNALTKNNQTNNNVSEIVRATIALAHNLGMSVVAEGIETEQQLKLLQSYDCDFGQGYFFARPMSPADATEMMLKGLQT